MRNLVYFFLSFPIAFFLLEIITRLLIWCISINFLIWTYGIDSSVNFEIDNLVKLDFLITNEDAFIQNNKDQLIEEKFDLLEAWAFGGSTSAGFNCGEVSSSWPNELNKLNFDFTIKNYAKNGSNSDFAYFKLLDNLNKDNFPDLVIWAGRVNELDVLTRGFKRNKEKLDLPDYLLDSGSSNFLYNVKTIDKTIKKYSVFYRMLDGIALRLKNKINTSESYTQDFTDEELELAALNYKLNTEDAIRLSKIYNFQFIILTLVNQKDLVGNMKTNWDNILMNKISEISNSKNVIWIDTREYDFKYKNIEDLFCDNVHQTLEGNRQTATSIHSFMDQIIKN